MRDSHRPTKDRSSRRCVGGCNLLDCVSRHAALLDDPIPTRCLGAFRNGLEPHRVVFNKRGIKSVVLTQPLDHTEKQCAVSPNVWLYIDVRDFRTKDQ